ncbi:hypothetical protein P7C70_g7629, partial [Phenoliferia sp. Uapishka_3]
MPWLSAPATSQTLNRPPLESLLLLHLHLVQPSLSVVLAGALSGGRGRTLMHASLRSKRGCVYARSYTPHYAPWGPILPPTGSSDRLLDLRQTDEPLSFTSSPSSSPSFCPTTPKSARPVLDSLSLSPSSSSPHCRYITKTYKIVESTTFDNAIAVAIKKGSENGAFELPKGISGKVKIAKPVAAGKENAAPKVAAKKACCNSQIVPGAFPDLYFPACGQEDSTRCQKGAFTILSTSANAHQLTRSPYTIQPAAKSTAKPVVKKVAAKKAPVKAPAAKKAPVTKAPVKATAKSTATAKKPAAKTASKKAVAPAPVKKTIAKKSAPANKAIASVKKAPAPTKKASAPAKKAAAPTKKASAPVKKAPAKKSVAAKQPVAAKKSVAPPAKKTVAKKSVAAKKAPVKAKALPKKKVASKKA